MGGQDEQTPAEVKPLDGKVLDLLSFVPSFHVCSVFFHWKGRNHSTGGLRNDSVEFGI